MTDNKPMSTKSQQAYSVNKLLEPQDFVYKNEHTAGHAEPVKSNREIKVSKTTKVDGFSFIITVRLTFEKLIIQAVLNKKRD